MRGAAHRFVELDGAQRVEVARELLGELGLPRHHLGVARLEGGGLVMRGEEAALVILEHLQPLPARQVHVSLLSHMKSLLPSRSFYDRTL